MQDEPQLTEPKAPLLDTIREELDEYEDTIRKFRGGEIGEVKFQKVRLQLGTYAQRQEGVQMQRIKIPSGILSSEQLVRLADVADRYASGFLHITTREDVQLYYVKIEDCPKLMRELAQVGITTREACGNTVRNITACYRSGISPTEVFEVAPYGLALFQFLVRNKFNQVLGRKFKIAFEGCSEDHAGLKFHDMGFQAVIRKEDGTERRGFRAYLGGGLGGIPMLGILYSEFLPEEELMNLAAATLRVFDRYGERKSRMQARMKFLIKKIGWEKFKALVDAERKEVKLSASVNDYLKEAHRAPVAPSLPKELPKGSGGIAEPEIYEKWVRDSVTPHRFPGYSGVNVRLKLGDLLTDTARKLAEIAKQFSRGELRTTPQQNLFLPWASTEALPALYQALADIGLAAAGAETMEDTTTCPGSDTCRLGITSAKGLGATISEAMHNGLGRFKEITRDLRVKISGCPNGCAQHGIANIGFQGAAMAKDGKTVPCHELFVGGGQQGDATTFGERIGKYPAKNCVRVVEKLLELYVQEKQGSETFNACMARLGKERLKTELAPLAEAPSFEEDPDYYLDWGHENEKFAIRGGIKGECAGATVQEKVPILETAKEHLAQAEAFLSHKQFANAQIEAYEAMAYAARVPLYQKLVDPFTSEQAIWEFENIFARAGLSSPEWLGVSDRVEAERKGEPTEAGVLALIDLARKQLSESERLLQELLKGATTTGSAPTP